MTVQPGIQPAFGNPDTVRQDALDILRLDDADVDADRVGRHAKVALEQIQSYLGCDTWTDPLPESVQYAAALGTVELYRRKDAPFGVLNAWSVADAGPVRIGQDWANPVRYILAPFRCAWGIA